MSYMRGQYYIWTSGLRERELRVHFWVAGDEEKMLKDSVWALSFQEDQIMGCSLPQKIFDELVVMRYAELQEKGTTEKTEQRAVRKWGGNVGAMALAKKLGKPTALDILDKSLKKIEKRKGVTKHARR